MPFRVLRAVVHGVFSLFCRRSFLPLILLMAGSGLLRADDKPVAQPGFHLVPIHAGDGKVGYIQVQDTSNPYQNVKDDSSNGGSDHFSFNSTSSLANKSYDMGSDSDSKDGSYQKTLEKTFITKSYEGDDSADPGKSLPGLRSPYPTSAADEDSHSANGYDKTFATTSADASPAKGSGFTSSTSSYQGQKAEMGGHEIEKFANSMSSKTYEGPETVAVKRDLDQMNNNLEGLKDLPDRPLTIDEVRNLINHGVKPETDEKPAEPTKPLNDPSFKPEPLPEPPANPIGSDLKADTGVPAPGTMAPPQPPPPEDNEPLPQ
jgi:hypothetical protein